MNEQEIYVQFQKIRETNYMARRTRYRRSRLDRYRAEIELLDDAGASWRDITLWLRLHRRTKVHPTTVGRSLIRWKDETDNGEIE